MKKLLLLIFFLTITFLLSYFYLEEIFNLDELKQNLDLLVIWVNNKPLYSRFLFFISYVIFAGLSFPFLPSILTIAAGALFGILEGVILVSFASTIGACICFLISRYLLSDFINNRFIKIKSLVFEKFRENGHWSGFVIYIAFQHRWESNSFTKRSS